LSREEEALREKILILAATTYGALFVLRAEDLFHHEEELVDEKPVDDTLRRGMWAVEAAVGFLGFLNWGGQSSLHFSRLIQD